MKNKEKPEIPITKGYRIDKNHYKIRILQWFAVAAFSCNKDGAEGGI